MGRRKDSGAQISLFPFLSILAALIGALVVLIAGMAIIQLQKAGGEEPEEVQRRKENKELLAEIDKLKLEQQQLRELLDLIRQLKEKLLLKMTERNTLKSLAESIADAEKRLLEMLKRYNDLLQTNEELLADAEKFKKEIEELKKQLKEEDKAEDDEPPIQVRPGGSAKGRRPYFIEAAAGKVSVIRKGQEPVEIPVASLHSSEEFKKFLSFIDANPDTQIVFLIRNSPQAVSCYDRANRVVQNYASNARRSDFRAVKMPLPGAGELDLSLFEQLMQ